MKTPLKVIPMGAQEILVTNSAFFNQVKPQIAKEALDFMEQILREKRSEIFKEEK
jgi:hypothetical protein